MRALRLEALRLITLRALTGLELRKKLILKGGTGDEAAQIEAEFRSRKLLDETTIAEDEIRRSVESRLVGRRDVRRRLLRRGVDEDKIAQGLEEGYTPEAEYEAGLRFGKKKLRLVEGMPVAVQYRRIGAALDRRGFPSAIIQRVLDELGLTHD